MTTSTKPKLAVWKFASCDGCQLTLLDCEDELLAVADRVDIAYFLEASSATVEGPYDVSLVEGSITTPHDVERIREVRRQSRFLVTIGACATAGGIQALRNFGDVEELLRIVYATPSFLSTLDSSTPISEHVAPPPETMTLRSCIRPPSSFVSVRQAQSALRAILGVGAFLVLMCILPDLAVAQDAGLPGEQMGQQSLRPYWHVFAAYSIVIALIAGWAFSIARLNIRCSMASPSSRPRRVIKP